MDYTRLLRKIVILIFFSALFAGGHSTGAETVSLTRGTKIIDSVEGTRFVFPCDIAVDSRGFFYVLDSRNRTVSIFSADMAFTKQIKLDGGKVRKPEGFDVSLPGMFVIADSANDTVVECDISGRVIQKWHIPEAGRLVDVGVYGKRIFAIDGEKSKVYVITREQKGYETLGGYGDHPGEFKYPYRVFISGNGRIYVSDVMNARVQILDIQGKMIGEIKSFGISRSAFLRPGGVYGDGSGTVYLTDMMSGLIFHAEEDTGSIALVRIQGKPFQLSDPVSLAISKGYMVVADQEKGLLYLVPMDEFDVRPNEGVK